MSEAPQTPWSEEAERSVLGGLLLNSQSCLDACMMALSPEHFFQRSHAIIFAVIWEMSVENAPVDAVTVRMRLKDTGRLEEVGGDYAIAQLAAGMATSAHAEYFIAVMVEKYKARRLIDICTTAIRESYASSDAMPQLEQDLFRLAAGVSREENELPHGVKEFEQEISLRDGGESSVVGLRVGIGAWQRCFGGILPSRYYVIGGRPGMGKSAMLEQHCIAALSEGKRVLYVSRELRRDRVVGRLCAKIAGVDYSKFLRASSSQNERDRLRVAAKKLLAHNLYLVTPSHMTGSKLRSLMRRAHRQQAVDLVVVDYMQKLDREKGLDMVQGVARNSEEISAGINETGIPAIVAIQLNRESEKENRRPRMSDIKESGQIEQDADCVALLWNPNKEKPLEGTMREMLMTVGKNRDGATDVDEPLFFNGPTMEFMDRITHE
jgi:replicative DNA helicase